MRNAILAIIAVLWWVGSAHAQVRLPNESQSHVIVLVDLSGTWFNQASKEINKHELETVATTIASIVAAERPPIDIRYFEIGDGSLSRAPLCEARFVPNIFRQAHENEFADLDQLVAFFKEDCTRFILMHKPELYTDITGALNTVARVSAEDSGYHAIIMMSDFQEERRPHQVGTIGSLKGMHALLLYRVLEKDRFDTAPLDERIAHWKVLIHGAGASVAAVDDVALDPAQLVRLLQK